MNFADEEYVRLYVVDTVTWRVLPWESRAVLVLALRRFDHAGVFEFGRHGAERALSAAIDVPLDVVTRAIGALFDEDIWRLESDRLFWPKYIEAQNCKRSDRLRQRLSRARRAESTPEPTCDEPSQSEPIRDNASQPVIAPSRTVTDCHDSRELSHLVTPGRGRQGEGKAGREGQGGQSGSDARGPAILESPRDATKTAQPPPKSLPQPPQPENASAPDSVPRRASFTIPGAPVPRRPTEAQLEAVGRSLAERAREVQSHQGDPTWLSMLTPQLWPELIESAKLFHTTWQLADPILGNYTRDKGVQALVELYSAGVDQATLLGAIRATRGDEWFQRQSSKSRPGLTMLTPEVVRRLVPKPRDAAWEAEIEKLAQASEASRKKLAEQRNAE